MGPRGVSMIITREPQSPAESFVRLHLRVVAQPLQEVHDVQERRQEVPRDSAAVCELQLEHPPTFLFCH